MVENNISNIMIKYKENYKLKDVCYYKFSKLLSVNILTNLEDNLQREEIENAIKSSLNLSIKYSFKYQQPNESLEFYFNTLSNWLAGKYNYCKLKLEDIKLDVDDKNVKISITVDDKAYKQLRFEDFSSIDDITSNTFKNVDVKMYPKNLKILEDEKADNILETREKLLSVSDNSEKIEQKTFKISGLDIITGKNFSDMATCLNKVDKEYDFIQVAGKISYLTERTFQKKVEVDGKEETEEKLYYTFDLSDEFGKIHASYFPTKAYLNGEKKIENDQIVTICGKVQEYRNSLSLNVKEIAYCCLPENQLQTEIKSNIKTGGPSAEAEKNIVFNSEPEEYKFVFPVPYSELNQMDMFALMNTGNKQVATMLRDKDYVVFDLETTGFDYINGEILEIGAVKIRNGKIIETFETLCKPHIPIPSDSTKVHGITDEMVKDAPRFSQVVGDFYKFTRNSTLVAHNAEFDVTFLDYHAVRNKYNFDNSVLDTLEMSRRLIKGLRHYKLIDVATYLGVDLEHAHRALFDTMATAKSFIELCKLEDK